MKVNNSKIVCIHQPDFMPWLGFFNKINNADIWVVLDHVKNNPRDASFWGRRVKMMVNKQPKWISIPLQKPIEKNIIGVPINKMKINVERIQNLKKTKITIMQAYKNYPYFLEVFPIIENYFNFNNEESLIKKNMDFILKVMKVLKIGTKIVYSSDINCTKKSTELLIEIIKKLNGNIYLAGGGAEGYQNDTLFGEHNVKLMYNNFNHPIYPQYRNNGDFIPGLSIVDALMNIGFEGVRRLLDNK